MDDPVGLEPTFWGPRPHVLPLDDGSLVESVGTAPASPGLQSGALLIELQLLNCHGAGLEPDISLRSR